MNLFCCFRKKKSIDVKDSSFESDNVLVTADRFTEMSDISDYSKSISFFYRDDTTKIIDDLLSLIVLKIEYKMD